MRGRSVCSCRSRCPFASEGGVNGVQGVVFVWQHVELCRKKTCPDQLWAGAVWGGAGSSLWFEAHRTCLL